MIWFECVLCHALFRHLDGLIAHWWRCREAWFKHTGFITTAGEPRCAHKGDSPLT